jgi:hypothetical protein
VLINNDEAPTSGTEDHPGTPGVTHEGTAATEPVSNYDNPSPLGPPTSDDDSDSDDEDDDAAGNNDGIEAHHSEIPNEEVYHPDTMTPSVQRMYGLRPKRARDYSHMFSHVTVMHHVTKQYSLKKGLRKFQRVGEEAVSKELKQLHMRDNFTPQDSGKLTDTQKRGALESLMFLKEKRNNKGPRVSRWAEAA